MIPSDRDLNTVTAQEWAMSTPDEREAFIDAWRHRGHVAFRCLRCGFPLVHGWSHCEACDLAK